MTLHEQKQHRLGRFWWLVPRFPGRRGVFTRLIPNDLTMLFWRGLFRAARSSCSSCIKRTPGARHPGGLRWPALAVACLSSLGMITGISALRYTNVADAMVIYATVPFVTAGLAYLFIGERPAARHLACCRPLPVSQSCWWVRGGSMASSWL
jgi:drug/metabolite transporter (DMT)-like permease